MTRCISPKKKPTKNPRGNGKQRETTMNLQQLNGLVRSAFWEKTQVTGSLISRLLIRRFRVRFPGDPPSDCRARLTLDIP